MSSSSWETYRKLLPSMKSKQGVAVAFVHWRLSSKELECLGTGEKFCAGDKKVEDDALFRAFDAGRKPIRYARGGRKFVLRSHPIHDGCDLMVFLEATLDGGESKSAAAVLDLGVVQKDMSVGDASRWTRKVDDLWEKARKASSSSSSSKESGGGLGGRKKSDDDDDDRRKDSPARDWPPRRPTPPAPAPKKPYPDGPPPEKPLPEPMPRFPDPGKEPDVM